MRITLNPFRCYEDFTLEINENSRTLIEGRSGVGKSTIFSAIYWVLFGTLRLVYPRGTQSACRVVLDIGSIRVTRMKKPDRLTVEFNGGSIEGEDAQNYIDSIFGDKDTFVTTSYIQQGSRCTLLSSSNTERMDFLNKISFSDVNPQEVAEKISSTLLPLSTTLSDKTIEYNTLYSNWKPLEYIEADVISAVELKKLEDHSGLLRSTYDSLVSRISKNTIALGSLKNLQDQLSKLELSISSIEDRDLAPILEELESLVALKIAYDKHQADLRRVASLNGQLPKIQGVVGNPTDDEISRLQEQEQAYVVYQRQLSSLTMPNASKELLEPLELQLVVSSKYESSSNDRRELKVAQDRVATLEKDISSRVQVKPGLAQEIDDVRNTLRDVRRSQDVLTCPSCSVSLRLCNDSLSLANDAPSTNEQLVEVQNTLKVLEKQLTDEAVLIKRQGELENARYNVDTLSKRLEGVEVSTIPSSTIRSQIDNIKKNLNILNSMKAIEAPTSSSAALKQHQRYSQLQREIDSIVLSRDVVYNANRVNELNSIKESITRSRYQKDAYTSQLVAIQDQISRIVVEYGLEDEANGVANELNTLYIRINASHKANKLNVEYQRLARVHQEIEDTTQHAVALTELLQVSKRVESDLLQNCVDGINDRMEVVLSSIFEDPISVRLSLYKELKTKKTMKSQVNLSISYRGGEYDNISQLSGGEGDRISFALNVALNSISNSPLLLLDESFSSLDGEYRSSCVKSLLCLSNKTVCVVSHEDVQGLYDYSISL